MSKTAHRIRQAARTLRSETATSRELAETRAFLRGQLNGAPGYALDAAYALLNDGPQRPHERLLPALTPPEP